MAIPLIALAAGAIGFNFFDRGRRQTAFNVALESFTQQPGGTDPGSVTGAQLTPRQAEGLRDLYRSSPARATTMLNSIQGRNQTAHQNTLTRELQWLQLGQARQTYALGQDRFTEQKRQFEIDNDLEQIRLRKEAGDLLAVYVYDPLVNARVRTDAPGSPIWVEKQAKAVITAQASDTLNRLLVSTAKVGVDADPSSIAGRAQQSLRTQLVGQIKEMFTLGALDKGVFEFATGLVGDELNVADFVLGTDAAALSRLLTTQGLFNQQMVLREEDIRLLQNLNPLLVQGFQQTKKESALLNQFVTERMGKLQAAGGNIEDLRQQAPGETFLGNEARGGPVQLIGDPPPESSQLGAIQATGAVGLVAGSGLSNLRAQANVFGSQIDNIVGGAIAFLLGRGAR